MSKRRQGTGTRAHRGPPRPVGRQDEQALQADGLFRKGRGAPPPREPARIRRFARSVHDSRTTCLLGRKATSRPVPTVWFVLLGVVFDDRRRLDLLRGRGSRFQESGCIALGWIMLGSSLAVLLYFELSRDDEL